MDVEVDRRSNGNQRVPWRGAVELEELNAPFVVGSAINIGLGGLSVQATSAPEVGTPLLCRFESADGKPISAEAEVVWTRPSEDPAHMACGLRFTHLPADEAAMIEAWIHDGPSEATAAPLQTMTVHVEGFASPLEVARVDEFGSWVVTEQDLSCFKLGTKVALVSDDAQSTKEAAIRSVELSFDGSVPKLLMTFEKIGASVAERKPRADETWRDLSFPQFEIAHAEVPRADATEPQGLTEEAASQESLLEKASFAGAGEERSVMEKTASQGVAFEDVPFEDAALGDVFSPTHESFNLNISQIDAADEESAIDDADQEADEAFFDAEGHEGRPVGRAAARTLVVRFQQFIATMRLSLRSMFELLRIFAIGCKRLVVRGWRRYLPVFVQGSKPILTVFKRLPRFAVELVSTQSKEGGPVGRQTVAGTRAMSPRVQRSPVQRSSASRRTAQEVQSSHTGRRFILITAALGALLYGTYSLARRNPSPEVENAGQAANPNANAEGQPANGQPLTGTDSAQPTTAPAPQGVQPQPGMAPTPQPGAAPNQAAPAEEDFYDSATAPIPQQNGAMPRALPEPSYREGRVPQTSYPPAPEVYQQPTQNPAVPSAPTTAPANYNVQPRGYANPPQPSYAHHAPYNPAPVQAAPAPGGSSFGAPEVPGGRSFLIRMSQPVEGLIGETTATGFRITVPGSLALDRAGPIATVHPAVSRSAIVNRGDRSELSVDFAQGRRPPFRVVGRGSALEVLIGR